MSQLRDNEWIELGRLVMTWGGRTVVLRLLLLFSPFSVPDIAPHEPELGRNIDK